MASRPQLSTRSPCFGHWHCDHDITMQVHESSQPTTLCKAWQPLASNTLDRLWDWLSCRCNGWRMAKSYQQNHWNYIQIEAIHPQSYRQLVHEGIKIPGRYNSSWNNAFFFLKSSGPLNCIFAQNFDICWIFLIYDLAHHVLAPLDVRYMRIFMYLIIPPT